MLLFGCGACDEVGGHLRLLDGISFLFYFFVGGGKGEGVDGTEATMGHILTVIYDLLLMEQVIQCHNVRGLIWL